MVKYDLGLKKIVEKKIGEGADYIEILRSCYGADPREVYDVYKQYKTAEPDDFKWKNLYPQFPEPHPAYSQWRLNPESAELIIGYLSKKNYKDICFLSCPILGTTYSKITGREIAILDIDSQVMDFATKNSKLIKYNLNDDIPQNLKGRFQCVVCDPPWYLEDIELVIIRAAKLVAEGGSIYLSIPRLLTKPSIINERLLLQKKISEWGLVMAEIKPIVSYEVPPFEINAYRDIPCFSGRIWRYGDWLKLKKIDNTNIDHICRSSSLEWKEINCGVKRVFLRSINESDCYVAPKLRHLVQGDILNTVSRRNPYIDQIGIWTSRNAIMTVESGYDTIEIILRNIQLEDEDIAGIIAGKFNIDKKAVVRDCIGIIDELRRLIEL